MSIQIGVNIPNFGPHASPGTALDWTRRAEDARLSIVMMSDHVTVTPDVARSYPAPFLEAFTTLSWLAGQTSLRVGTTVAILPYRHALLVEAMAGTLARITGGRFVLGVGVGWARKEFRALGVQYDQRAALADETLAGLAAHRTGAGLWPAAGDGARVTADPLAGLPVWVGGNGPAAIRRAARYGTAWHPLGITPAQLADGRTRLDEEARLLSRARPVIVPRVRLIPEEEPVPPQRRQLGQGTWRQIESDLLHVAESGAPAIILDTYHLTSPASAQPDAARDWWLLRRAIDILRSA